MNYKSLICATISCALVLYSCTSRPPIPTKKDNGGKEDTEQIDNSDKVNNTSDTVSHTTQLPEVQPINEDNLNLGNFPRVIRNWINNDILPIYGKDINIEWLNDYQVRVLYNVGSITYGDSVALKRMYGKYAKYQSFKYQHYIEQRVEWQITNDIAYKEIINTAKTLCNEIEYDWGNFRGYNGKFQPSPNKKQCVCDGYANIVCEQFLRFDFVTSVEKWIGGNHAWNIINFMDGRKLYVDLCWFDGEMLDKESGQIEESDMYNWLNITYNKEEFMHSNIGYGTNKFCHLYGKLYKTFKKKG